MGLFGPSKKEKLYAQTMAPQWLRIGNDCSKILQTTVNPDTFFDRFDLFIETLENMARIEKIVKFSGFKPSLVLRETYNERTIEISKFIERYYEDTLDKVLGAKTKKTKINKIENFKNRLDFYAHKMESENINLIHDLYERLNEDCESSEKLNEINKRIIVKSTPSASNENWNIKISFGKSSSQNYDKAVFMAMNAPQYDEETIGEDIVHNATYSQASDEYLIFVQLYELVSGWKSVSIFINEKLIDKKILGQINYCYGDKCRSGNKKFCFGASEMTKNPFGCHRLQISAYNHPWWGFYDKRGANYVLDKSALKERIDNYANVYNHCPCFDYQYILKALDDLPTNMTHKQYEKIIEENRIKIF